MQGVQDFLLTNTDLTILTQEQENPYSNVESFDTIYYAALQVIIVASANGVSTLHNYLLMLELTWKEQSGRL